MVRSFAQPGISFLPMGLARCSLSLFVSDCTYSDVATFSQNLPRSRFFSLVPDFLHSGSSLLVRSFACPNLAFVLFSLSRPGAPILMLDSVSSRSMTSSHYSVRSNFPASVYDFEHTDFSSSTQFLLHPESPSTMLNSAHSSVPSLTRSFSHSGVPLPTLNSSHLGSMLVLQSLTQLSASSSLMGLS